MTTRHGLHKGWLTQSDRSDSGRFRDNLATTAIPGFNYFFAYFRNADNWQRAWPIGVCSMISQGGDEPDWTT